MKVRFLLSVLLLLCLGWGSSLSAQTSPITSLGSGQFTQTFDGATVKAEISAGIDQGAERGVNVLHIDLSSRVSGGSGNERALLINCLVAIACPPGVKPLAQPRPYWFSASGDQYEFMYSKDLPELQALEGRSYLMKQALSGGPAAMFRALAELSTSLDPQVVPKGPVDPRLSGTDRGYTIGGVTWLLPVTIGFDELVPLYDSESGLANEAQLRVSVPLAIDTDATDPFVLVYVGGLSAAAKVAEVRADELSGTAIALEDIPPLAEGDEVPQVSALLYSYMWVSWEKELHFESAETEVTSGELRGEDSARAAEVEAASMDETEAQTNTDTAIDVFVPEESGEDSSVSVGESEERAELNTVVIENESAAAEESDDDVETGGGSGDESVATAVEPGTIPQFDSEYVIPLKPITNPAPQGGASARTPISSGMLGGAPTYSAPPDLGEMILIPEGYFLMGTGESAQDSDEDERPQQQIFLPSFYIDKYLVTNRQFYEFVLASGYKPQGNWERHFSPATADLPVRGIGWEDCNAYARWAGKRLPTEAEWEKAMRGTDGRTYPWGEEWSASILPRGEFNYDVVIAPDAASPYGLMATVGVLWQWTSSSYAPYPYNPDASSQYKVLRGGSFSNGRNVVRCANRYSEASNVALNTFGFRCAKDA
jgi:formylglycine-generating enzyme required for sulfatase activity